MPFPKPPEGYKWVPVEESQSSLPPAPQGFKWIPADDEQPREIASIPEEVGKGLKAGIQQIRGMGYGVGALVGEATDVDPLKEWSAAGLEDVAKKTPLPTTPSYADITDISDLGRYLAYGIASNTPNLALSLAGGGIGGVTGRIAIKKAAEEAVKTALKQGATKEVALAAGKKLINDAIEKGAVIGAGSSSIGMETGSIASDQLQETGKVDPLRALAGGIPAGILDIVPEWYLAKKLGWLGKGAKEFTGNRLTRAGKVAGQQFAVEAPTEAMQSVIERKAVPGKSISNAEAWDEYINAFILGGATGGILGGAGGVFTKAQPRVNTPTNEPPIDNAPPEPPPGGNIPPGGQSPPGGGFNTFNDFTNAYTEGATEEELKGKRDEYSKRPDADPNVLSDVDGLLSAIKEQDVDNRINELKALVETGGITQDELIPAAGKLLEAYPNESEKIKSAFPNVPFTLKDAIKKSEKVAPFSEESDKLNENIINNIAVLKKNDGVIDNGLQKETEVTGYSTGIELATELYKNGGVPLEGIPTNILKAAHFALTSEKLPPTDPMVNKVSNVIGDVEAELKKREAPPVSEKAPAVVAPAKAEGTATQDKGAIPEQKQGVSPVIEVPVDQIKISEDVPQFKGDANEIGVVQELQGTEYRRVPMNAIIVWERLNGDLEVITGRHRLDLARRIGEKTIPAQIVKESEGFDKQKALTFDAEQNILDNQGTEKDYANYFRNTEISEEEAKLRGLLRGAKASSAWILGRYATDQTFNAYFRTGEISFKQAVAVSKAAPNDERLQLAGRSFVLKNPRATESEVENFVHALSLVKDIPQQKQGDLFGFDDSAIRTAEMQAKKAASIIARLKKDSSHINAAIRGEGKLELSKEGAKEYGIEDSKDKEQLKNARNKILSQISEWEKWYVNPELVQQLTETKTGQPETDVKTEKTEVGEQAVIPGASYSETFSLTNPETEISKPLSEQKQTKNEDLFSTNKPIDQATSPNGLSELEQEAVHDKLTPSDKKTICEVYGSESYDKATKARFVDDVVKAINSGLDTVHEKLRPIIAKLKEIILAMTAVFTITNFSAGTIAYSDISNIQQQYKQVQTIPQSVGELGMSESALNLYKMYVPSAQKTGKPFIIADKPSGKIFVISKDGKIIASSNALYGKQVGDFFTEEQDLDKMGDLDKITPAGVFTISYNKGDKEYPAGYFSLEESRSEDNSIIAIHSVILENHLKKDQKGLHQKKRQIKEFFCCINTDDMFLKEKLLPIQDELDSSFVVVVPDNPKMVEKFAANRVAETKFQRGPKSSGLQQSQAQSVIDKAVSSIPNAPKVNVVQSNKDCPAEVQKIMEREGIDDAMGFTYKGEVYLVADNLRNQEEVLRTLAHELTHSGLGKFFQRQTKGKIMTVRVKYEALMDSIYRAHSKEIEQLAKTTHTHLDTRTVQGRRQACEEWLCNQSYEAQSKWYDKLVAIFHDLLRAVGLDVKLSDAEVRVVLQDAFKEFGSEGVSFMTAWHGSPHDFDKFSKDKIGTGEGAQAYGYGLYFGGRREIGEFYRKSLTKGTSAKLTFDGEEIAFPKYDNDLKLIFNENYTKQEIRDIIGTAILDAEHFNRNATATQLKEILNKFSTAKDIKLERGRLYQVELAPAEDEYLLWDKPLSEQSEKVKAAINNIHHSNYMNAFSQQDVQHYLESQKGADLYQDLSATRGVRLNEQSKGAIRNEPDDKWASDYLHSLGIRGIKYLDGSSRNRGPWVIVGEDGKRTELGDEKTARAVYQREIDAGRKATLIEPETANHNYVIFSDEDIEVTAKFQRRSPVRRSQPIFSKPANATKQWWVGMDIQKQLESLPRESWQRVRNFLREGYVPITRAEADELYYKGFDYTVALVEMRGPVDSVGNEGVFMKPLNHWSYGGRRYDGTYQYFKDAIAKYHEAAKRFQEAIPQTTRENTAPESEESEVWKLKAAEPEAKFERRGLKDTGNEGKNERNRTTRENGDVGLADDSRRERDDGVPYSGGLQRGRNDDSKVRTTSKEYSRGERAGNIPEANKKLKEQTNFQRQEKEAFDEASEPTPPEFDLGAYESKRKEIEDYVGRSRRSIEEPELVMLAKDLLKGRFPLIKERLRSAFGNSAFGKFIPQGEGNILLKASIFSDLQQASKTLAHEIGHLIDYLPGHTMKRGNILGRIASLNRYMKNYLEEFKGAPGLLTKEDRARLQKEAREQIKSEEKPDEVIVEEIIKEIPQYEISGVTPEIILDLMRGRVEGKFAPELYEYLQRAGTKEKKQIVLQALKQIVDERVTQFGTKKQVGTEVVKETVERVIPGVKYDAETIYKRFKELLQAEINKRVLYQKETITNELKKLTKLWTPFDDSVDSPYRKYRWSSVELYADAFSVFINYPELMQKEAPTFYKAFLSWIESKPEVKEVYDSYQELSQNREAVLERREKYFYEMQKDHKTKEQEVMEQIQADSKINPRNILRELYKGLIDRNIALMEAVKKLKKAGKVTAANSLEYFKEERNYLASEADFYLEEVKDKIITPLEKAGFTEDDLGYLGTLMRTATQRRGVANPGGMGGYFSDEQIEHLKTKLGTERFNTLKGILEKFSDLRQDVVIPKLEEAGMYSEALLNTMKTQKNYLTFNVTKFLDKMYGGLAQSALGKVYHTIGTFQDIQNPFIATIFKDISLMRAAEITKYKKELRKAFSENEELQDQIQPAEKKFNGTVQVFAEPKDPKMGMVTYLNNGKVEAFYITKEIADDFNNKPVEAMHILKFFNAIMMPVKAMLVNRNPIWMFRNVVRDYLGTAQNIPGATVTNLLPYYRKAFMDAWGEVMQGKKLNVVQQMKKGKMLVIDRQYHLSDDMSDDTEFDKLYAKFGHYGETKRHSLIEPLARVWDFLGDLGKVSERAGKVAGYRWMKENTNMTEREIGHVVRSRIGTPDVYRRGAWQLVTNNLFLYSNVGKEGFRSSWESFQDNKAAFAWKMVKYNFLPKALLALAALGAFGDDAEDIIKRISNYDKANYLVVPFYKTSEGKAVYLRMPQSYMGQVFGAIAWDLFNLEFKKAIETVASDQPYSFNPVIKAALNWGLYAMDTNPQDWYRGQNIVNRKEWDAGEPYRLMEMSKNTWNSLGGTLLWKFNKGQDPKGVWENLSSLPGLNIVGSFLKESNQGLKEEYNEASALSKRDSAIKSMSKDERIAKRERIKRQLSDARSLYKKGYINKKMYDERVNTLHKALEN